MEFSQLGSLNFRHIIFRGKRYDRNTVNGAIDHMARHLRSNIRSTSPFILLTAYNHIKTLIAYYAILRTGKIAAILDPEWKSMEASEIIEDIEPAAIIYLNTETTGFKYDEEIVFRKANKAFIISSDLADVCTLAYTNAEDGYSKGAMLTEKNLLAEINALICTNKLTKNSVTFALLPFSHLFGLVQGILVPTHAGSTGIISEFNILKINELLTEIKQNKATHIYTVPAFYYILSKVPEINEYIGSVKEFYSGGTKLAPLVFNNFFKKTKKKIREGYGLTESSPGVALNYLEEGPKIDSIGIPLPGCNIKILNDNNIECPADSIGKICVKGDMVFKGYFNKEATTRETLKNGWLYTGDLGKIDKDGFIYFCGLKKNMINVAGNKIYPKKLERLLKQNPNVIDVKVYSEESILQGQIVHAEVKMKNSSIAAQNDFKEWCFKNITNVSLPKVWNFE